MRVLVIHAERARTRGIAAVHAVVAHVAIAEAILAHTVVGAVVHTVVQVIVPHVIYISNQHRSKRDISALTSHKCRVRERIVLWLLRQSDHASIHEDLIRIREKDSFVLRSGKWFHILQFHGKVCAAVIPVAASIPSYTRSITQQWLRGLGTWSLFSWLSNEYGRADSACQAVKHFAARRLCKYAGAAFEQCRVVRGVVLIDKRPGVLHRSRRGKREDGLSNPRPIGSSQRAFLRSLSKVFRKNSKVRIVDRNIGIGIGFHIGTVVGIRPVVRLLGVGQDIKGIHAMRSRINTAWTVRSSAVRTCLVPGVWARAVYDTCCYWKHLRCLRNGK